MIRCDRCRKPEIQVAIRRNDHGWCNFCLDCSNALSVMERLGYIRDYKRCPLTGELIRKNNDD